MLNYIKRSIIAVKQTSSSKNFELQLIVTDLLIYNVSSPIITNSNRDLTEQLQPEKYKQPQLLKQRSSIDTKSIACLSKGQGNTDLHHTVLDVFL
jgi:hypothetical protein